MHRLPGEKQKQQDHRNTENGGAISAHHCAQATHTKSHQDTVAHTTGQEQEEDKETCQYSYFTEVN